MGTRAQGHRLWALVAVVMAILAGHVGGVAGRDHAGEGLVQEGVEAFAMFCVLVDAAHR